MQITNEKRELIKTTLLDNMSVLEGMLSGNSEIKRRAIQLNIESLKLGWIHFALIGQTSCGKSTVNNALSDDIVVPENPMTATPIPTYIAKASIDVDTQRVTIIPEDEKKSAKELTRKEFLTQYCFNVEDQDPNHPGRLRFKYDRYAIARSKGKLFDKGAVLLDTLGTGATEMDNIKTSTILKGNVDFIIYIVGANMLTTSDIAFLQYHILGYSPKEPDIKKLNYKVEKPLITSDRLLILGNDKNGILRSGLVNSVKRIFKSDDCKLTDAQINEFCENNIWVANALYGRLDSAGFYDFVENAPAGSDESYLQGVAKLNKRHKRLIEDIEDGDDDALAEIKTWNNFKDRIGSVCDNCFDSESEFLKIKCDRVINDFKESKQIFEKNIQDLSGNLGNIKDRTDKLDKISNRIGDQIENIPQNTHLMAEKMIQCVTNCINNDLEPMVNRLYSDVIANEMDVRNKPPKKLPDYKNVKKMTDAQRLNALEPIIQPIITDLLSKCGLTISNYLWSLSGSSSEDITDDVPIKHYRLVTEFLNGHINNLIGIVDLMREADISIVGILLPNKEDLKVIGTALEKGILKAISSSFDSMADTKNWASVFKESMPSVLKQGFFRSIANWFKGGVSSEQFWDKIRYELIPKIVLKMGVDAMQQIEKTIRPDVNTAYSHVEHTIRDIYKQCERDCGDAIKKMNELNEASKIEELIEIAHKKIDTCDEAIAQINHVLYS